MTKKVLFLLLALGIFSLSSIAQPWQYSSGGDYFFNDQDYEKLSLQAVVETAKMNGKDTLLVTNTAYAILKTVMLQAQPDVQTAFLKLDKKFSIPITSKEEQEIRKLQYIKSLKEATRKTILNDAELLRALSTNDDNDRVLSFLSDITVQTDGALLVKETITIYNGSGASNGLTPSNSSIQRGITRSFPTSYKTHDGFLKKVGFEILSLTKDGMPEPYHTESAKNGTIAYFGSANAYLENGRVYTYVFTYKTDRQLLFNTAHDELYWNVNGNGWEFMIDRIGCNIHFPEGAHIQKNNCYTGAYGSKSQNCAIEQIDAKTVAFHSNWHFLPKEGLTVISMIDKGIIQEPTKLELLYQKTKDNFILPLAALFGLIITIVNGLKWLKVGKDPKAGVVYPQFEPPKGFSPADCAYSLAQKYETKQLSAAIVDYAVHRKVEIKLEKKSALIFSKDEYYFKTPENYENDPLVEERIAWYGFSPDDLHEERISKGDYNADIAKLNTKLKDRLKSRLEKSHIKNTFKEVFALNNGFTVVGFVLLIGLGVFAFAFLVNNSAPPKLLVWTVGLLLISFIIHAFFSKIMSAYTVEGRKIVDHILGFKMYLEAAEEKVFDHFTPPDKSLELFERYLPYAIALNCENKWSQKFEGIIETAMNGGYEPTYYPGSYSSFNSSFSSTLSSNLSSTISSASVAPSSSGSGGGGGGFSGGGGGGGGGGGW